MRTPALLAIAGLLSCSGGSEAGRCAEPELPAERPNIVIILSDDHRYDAAGFMGHPYLETPQIDRLAAEGIHFGNTFVTTSLCSPSRASILTGLYAHNHGIVDNRARDTDHLPNSPSFLQGAGYQTAFIGKRHMGGGSDNPRPGCDHWVSFLGQGEYLPPPDRDRSLA